MNIGVLMHGKTFYVEVLYLQTVYSITIEKNSSFISFLYYDRFDIHVFFNKGNVLMNMIFLPLQSEF